MAQCQFLEDQTAPVKQLIVLECSDETLRKRLGAAHRQRFDDTDDETISGRIQTFRETTSHVITTFEARNCVARVDGEQSIETVVADLRALVRNVLESCGRIAVENAPSATAPMEDASDIQIV
jgi:adenylate kinase family enzyme